MQRAAIGTIIPNPVNPRIIKDDKFKKLVKSIQDFPQMLELRPIVVDGNMVVLGGNMRLKACIAAGLKEVPIIVADQLTDAQKAEFIIKDNVGFGEWDWDLLANQWDVEALEDWGLELPFDNTPVLEAEEDDYEAPSEIKTDVVLGDLIEIGNHRLLCGDSTDSDQVAKLVNGQKIDLVFTDPPYGVSVVSSSGKVGGGKETTFGAVGGGGGSTKKGKNKWVDSGQYAQIIGDDTTDTAREFYNTCVSLDFKNYIIWGGNYFTDFLAPSKCWLVWDKENTGNFADVELAWTSFDKGAKLYKWLWNGLSRKGDRATELQKRVHPTQKPVGLHVDIFNDFKADTVYDGFGGSGTTMVACHQLNKKCFMIEMSPDYCQVIVDRMHKLDPSLEIKINGKPYDK